MREDKKTSKTKKNVLWGLEFESQSSQSFLCRFGKLFQNVSGQLSLLVRLDRNIPLNKDENVKWIHECVHLRQEDVH